MYVQAIMLLLFLMGCTPPIYQHTTYDIEEFISDSSQIAEGKQAILNLKNQEEKDSLTEKDAIFQDVVREGDELSITLYCPQRMDRMKSFSEINGLIGFSVCNGHLCLPSLFPVEVEGLTLKEVKVLLETKYSEQFPNTQIFVNFKKRYAQQVQIIGARVPLVNIRGRMLLSEVLAKARIPSNANLFKSYVIRDNKQLPLDLYHLIHEGEESQNIVMQGGDRIFIASAKDSTVMVTGEVPFPSVIPVPYGFISLREALAIAQGISFTGNKNSIQIIRGDFIRPKIYSLVWRDITHLPNHSLLLIPGDVVVISEKPIVEWNRFINQLQPSIIGTQSAYTTYQIIP